MGGVYIENLRKCIETTIVNYEPVFWERKADKQDVEQEIKTDEVINPTL
jgi:hypothetical protein